MVHRDTEINKNNVRVAFEAWEEGSLDDNRRGQKLLGYQEIHCHMIFDINMDRRFTRKDSYVAGGYTNDSPSSITYYIVVSRESVRIAFTLADLNDVEIRATDMCNAYFNTKC